MFWVVKVQCDIVQDEINDNETVVQNSLCETLILGQITQENLILAYYAQLWKLGPRPRKRFS